MLAMLAFGCAWLRLGPRHSHPLRCARQSTRCVGDGTRDASGGGSEPQDAGLRTLMGAPRPATNDGSEPCARPRNPPRPTPGVGPTASETSRDFVRFLRRSEDRPGVGHDPAAATARGRLPATWGGSRESAASGSREERRQSADAPRLKPQTTGRPRSIVPACHRTWAKLVLLREASHEGFLPPCAYVCSRRCTRMHTAGGTPHRDSVQNPARSSRVTRCAP